MTENFKILVVDDEHRIRESLKSLLCTRNYEVQTCCNGKEALNHLSHDKFDLVILDIFMEEMDGFQVIEKITTRKIEIPIIIITGHASTESAVRALRMGANDYLKKPFEPEELFISVENTLAQSKLKKNHLLVTKRLKESEERFHYLANASMEAIFFTKDGICLEANQTAADMFGYDHPEAFIGLFATQIIAQESHGIVKKHLLKNLSNSYEAVGERQDGTQFPLAIQPRTMPYKDKGIIRVTSIRDITKQKRNEEQLVYQTQMYKTLMGISSGCINIQLEKVEDTIQEALKKVGEFVAADRAYIFKYDFEKNIAINIYEWCNRGITPQIDSLQNYPLEAAADWVDFHQKGEPMVISEVSSLPLNKMRKALEQQQIKSLASVPMFHEDRLIGFTGFDSVKKLHTYSKEEIKLIQFFGRILVGLKMRASMENKLRKSEIKYRQLFKNAPAGIFEIDFQKFRFINVNDIMCSYTGYSEKEFLTMNPRDLLTQESNNLFIGRFEKFLAGQRLASNAEYSIIKKDGKKLHILLNIDYTYKREKITGANVIVHDITERRQAENEKIADQKIISEQKKLALIGQVAGKMAHDFNNILGAIMGNAELELLDCKDSGTRETLELIFEQTLRGKSLTKNLIAFAKSQELKQAFFQISDTIDLVINLLKKDLNGIRLRRDDQQEVPDLLADQGMIEHALVNLVQNSIHAVSMVEDPIITIKTYSFDNCICLELEDNGCGIPKEHLENIYDPAFTLKGRKDIEGVYERGIKGTGYGMANVKKYISQHKGKIFVESEFNSGTKFTLHLPVNKKELTKKEKAALCNRPIYSGKYILLVEDEAAISDVQYRVLTQEPCNHKLDIAPNGNLAMDLFDKNEYDFISLDYSLPGKINGMDLYHHIRRQKKTIPILFVSGNLEFLESIQNLKQKDNYIDHISKPCSNKSYVNSINELFERILFAF